MPRLKSAARWLIAWLLLCAAIAAWRREVLALPPYGDNIIGLWTEANFLAETDFDYLRLRFREPTVWEGGALCYMISVLPTLLAAMMKLFSTTWSVIVAYHLFSIGSAAACLMAMFAMLRSTAGTLGAALVCLALLTTPLFMVQAEMVGMELQMTTAALLAACFVQREQYGLAAASSLAAFLMKATGAIVTIAIFVLLVTRLAASWKTTDVTIRRRLMLGIGAAALVLLVQAVLIVSSGIVLSNVGHSSGDAYSTLVMARYWCPDLVFILAVAAAISAAAALGWLWRHGKARDRRTFIRGLGLACREEPLFFLGWIVIALVLLSISRILFLPRYLLLGVPFLLMIVARLLFVGPGGRIVGTIAMGSLVTFNLANWEGRFYPSVEAAIGRDLARSFSALERSHEYLADLRSNIAAFKRLEPNWREAPIFVGAPFIHCLAFPRLGYVARPLHGYALNAFGDSSTAFPPVDQAILQPPTNPVFVSVGNTFYANTAEMTVPNREAADHLIYDDQQASPLVVFQKRWPGGHPSRVKLEDWYLERMWPHMPPLARAIRKAELLLAVGRPADAQKTLLASQPDRLSLPALAWQRALANSQVAQGALEEGVERYLDLVRYRDLGIDSSIVKLAQPLHSNSTAALIGNNGVKFDAGAFRVDDDFGAGLDALAAGRIDTASTLFARTLVRDPQHDWARRCQALLIAWADGRAVAPSTLGRPAPAAIAP